MEVMMNNVKKDIISWWSGGITSAVWLYFFITTNGSRFGEVAEHKTSLELQMFKLR